MSATKRKRLPATKVAAIIHHKLHGLPERRIAKAVGVTRGTVRRHVMDDECTRLVQLLIEHGILSLLPLTVPTPQNFD
jgi:predicted transcriptional regulator